MAQTNIQLILKANNKIDKLEANDFSSKQVFTVEYKDTINFNFNKSNIDLYNIGCYINDKKIWAQIWLDTGNIKVEAHTDSAKFIIDTIINSPIYYYLKGFSKEYSSLLKTKDTTQINQFLLSKLQENIKNPFSLWVGMLYLNLNQNNKNNVYPLKKIIAKQGEKFSNFLLYPDIIKRINNILSVDSINIPDFKFINRDNKTTTLILKNANYYILDFWYLGCAPCRREHKIIKQKLQYLRQNKIEIIGISTDRYSSEWKNYLSKNYYDWPNYLQAANKKITGSLSINSFPYYVVINSKGVIIGRYNLFSDILKKFKIDE